MKKSQLTPRAPDKCGALPALSSKRPQTADSASGGFVRQVPPLPVTPAVGCFLAFQVRTQQSCQGYQPDQTKNNEKTRQMMENQPARLFLGG